MTIDQQQQGDQGRVAAINVQNTRLPTPRLALYTKSGAIPYINYNFVRKHDNILYRDNFSTDDKHGHHVELLKVNVADLLDLHSSNSLNHLSSLAYFDNYAFVVTLYDPLNVSYQDLKSTNESIPVLTVHGKKMITVEELCNISRECGAAAVQSLADINTPPIAKKKWTAKATNRSAAFLEQTLNILNKKQVSENTAAIGIAEENKRIKLTAELGDSDSNVPRVWATVTGGFSAKDRADCCATITAHSDKLSGVIIDAFYGYHKKRSTADEEEDETEKNGDAVCFTDSFSDCCELLRTLILPALPPHLPRALWGVFYPDDICRLIHAGIDIVDSSICTAMTQRGLALPSPLIDLERVQLRFTRCGASEKDFDPSPAYAINLHQETHTRSNVPISSQCGCYTCSRSYSRAYINHLHRRNELNGSMLLQIHNHFALTQFFSHLRHLIVEHRFEQLLINSHLMEDIAPQQHQPEDPSV